MILRNASALLLSLRGLSDIRRQSSRTFSITFENILTTAKATKNPRPRRNVARPVPGHRSPQQARYPMYKRARAFIDCDTFFTEKAEETIQHVTNIFLAEGQEKAKALTRDAQIGRNSNMFLRNEAMKKGGDHRLVDEDAREPGVGRRLISNDNFKVPTWTNKVNLYFPTGSKVDKLTTANSVSKPSATDAEEISSRRADDDETDELTDDSPLRFSHRLQNLFIKRHPRKRCSAQLEQANQCENEETGSASPNPDGQRGHRRALPSAMSTSSPVFRAARLVHEWSTP